MNYRLYTFKNYQLTTNNNYDPQGFNSEFGVAVVVSALTNKVIDVEFMSRYCNKCNMRKAKANRVRTNGDDEDEETPDCPDCTANYVGSSGGMESFGAKIMFGRSLQWPEGGVMFSQDVPDRDSDCMFHIRNSYGELGLCDDCTRWNGVAADNKEWKKFR